jgi:MoxR-like ATPase
VIPIDTKEKEPGSASKKGRRKEMADKIRQLQKELGTIIKGKKEVTDKIIMAVLARGHVLLEDVPGVGKTTTALALCRLMGMDFNRIQFTPDVVPSDVTGFTMYEKQTGKFIYRPGAVMCNMLLADEINRTSSKTQAALLEVMEEGKVTVDNETHPVPQPFVVIATENPTGSSGTQMLPESQLDRFMISLSMGYPDHENLVELLRDRQTTNPLEKATAVITKEEVVMLQDQVQKVYMADSILNYIATLAEATRNHPMITLGLSPRGTLALCRMTKAAAFMEERDYVIPEDVKRVFTDVTAHRMILDSRARYQEQSAKDILEEILKDTEAPKVEGE